MADNKLLQQMLEHLVNDDQAKAEELFHEYVVTASREIYESLIDSEIAEEEEKEEDDEDMDEAAKDEDAEEDKVDEEFEDIAIEGDDDMSAMGGDPTDDLEGDIDAEMDDEDMGDKSEEELFQDLDSIVDELQATTSTVIISNPCTLPPLSTSPDPLELTPSFTPDSSMD